MIEEKDNGIDKHMHCHSIQCCQGLSTCVGADLWHCSYGSDNTTTQSVAKLYGFLFLKQH